MLCEEDNPLGTPFLVPGTGVEHGLALINNEKCLLFDNLPPCVPLVVFVGKIHKVIYCKFVIGQLCDFSVIAQKLIFFTVAVFPEIFIDFKVTDNILSFSVVGVYHLCTV